MAITHQCRCFWRKELTSMQEISAAKAWHISAGASGERSWHQCKRYPWPKPPSQGSSTWPWHISAGASWERSWHQCNRYPWPKPPSRGSSTWPWHISAGASWERSWHQCNRYPWPKPLHKAVAHGHDTSVQVLLEKGADINARDKRGRSPLHLAAAYGWDALVQVLLEKGAGINARDNLGQTPFKRQQHMAMTHCLRCFLRKGLTSQEMSPVKHQCWLQAVILQQPSHFCRGASQYFVRKGQRGLCFTASAKSACKPISYDIWLHEWPCPGNLYALEKWWIGVFGSLAGFLDLSSVFIHTHF